jgi:hypothetical protein
MRHDQGYATRANREYSTIPRSFAKLLLKLARRRTKHYTVSWTSPFLYSRILASLNFVLESTGTTIEGQITFRAPSITGTVSDIGAELDAKKFQTYWDSWKPDFLTLQTEVNVAVTAAILDSVYRNGKPESRISIYSLILLPISSWPGTYKRVGTLNAQCNFEENKFLPHSWLDIFGLTVTIGEFQGITIKDESSVHTFDVLYKTDALAFHNLP